MADEFVPTTEQVREAFRTAALHPDDIDLDDAPGQEFDRWLAAHDAEIREAERTQIVEMLDADIDQLESQAEDQPVSAGVMRAVRLINRRARLAAKGGAS